MPSFRDAKQVYSHCEMLLKQIVCNHPVATGCLLLKIGKKRVAKGGVRYFIMGTVTRIVA